MSKCLFFAAFEMVFFLTFIFTNIYESHFGLGMSCFEWRSQFLFMGPVLTAKLEITASEMSPLFWKLRAANRPHVPTFVYG